MTEAEQSRPKAQTKASSPDSKPETPPDPPALPASAEQSKAKTSVTSVEVRVALIAALAALIGALAGAIVSGYYTSTAVERQIAAQAEQGLREQRQGTYTQLIQHEQAVIHAEFNFWNLFRNNVTQLYPPLDEIREKKVSIELARAKYDLVSSAVSLIGASDTNDQIQVLNEAHDDFYITVDYALRLATTKASAAQSQEIDDRLNSPVDSLIEAHDDLLRLLRRDLAIN